MRQFKHRFRVRASLEDVAEFHSNPRALKLLTPPPIYVQFHAVAPLAENSSSEFTMWVGPFPVRWTALHTEYDPLKGFVDTQVKGPFKRWNHRHYFAVVDEKTTEIRDSIEAELGEGLVMRLVSGFMWFGLPLLFAYRAWITRKQLQNKEA
jgi:ligand-binding SRPBCC domain-containing protein